MIYYINTKTSIARLGINIYTKIYIGDDFIIGPCLAKVEYTAFRGVVFYIASSVSKTPAKLFDGNSSTYCLNTANISKVWYVIII